MEQFRALRRATVAHDSMIGAFSAINRMPFDLKTL